MRFIFDLKKWEVIHRNWKFWRRNPRRKLRHLLFQLPTYFTTSKLSTGICAIFIFRTKFESWLNSAKIGFAWLRVRHRRHLSCARLLLLRAHIRIIGLDRLRPNRHECWSEAAWVENRCLNAGINESERFCWKCWINETSKGISREFPNYFTSDNPWFLNDKSVGQNTTMNGGSVSMIICFLLESLLTNITNIPWWPATFIHQMPFQTALISVGSSTFMTRKWLRSVANT